MKSCIWNLGGGYRLGRKIYSSFVLVFFLLSFSFGSPSLAMAQKKELQAAKDQVKAGKDLEKAQASMEKLLKDSANRYNKKIWAVLFDALRKQYEQGNEKLYLKQQYDTARLFNLTRQLFIVAQDMDSVEMVPDRKGKVELEYRKPHAEYLAPIRSNLYNGGSWFVRKHKYDEAYKFFDLYISCAQSQLFKHYKFAEKDRNLSSAAYYAVYCGYKMKDSKATLHHSYEALKDTVHYNYMLQYLAETYKLDNDTARYLATLKEGFKRAPKFPYFFPRLVDYYVDGNQPDSAMVVVDKALAIDPENALYLYTKSGILLDQGKYKDCIAACDKVIALQPKMAEAYCNAGLAYYNMAVELDKNTQVLRMRHDEIQAYYKKALPYLVKYREMAPNAQDKWAFPLYTIYLNLNMGKEFDEIDKLMKQSKHR